MVWQGGMLVNASSTSEQQVASQGSSAGGSQSKPILAYKGQLMHWRLLVANTGQELWLAMPGTL